MIETVQRIGSELPKLPDAHRRHAHSGPTPPRASAHGPWCSSAHLSVALVITIVLIFLRTVRATIIAGVALPLSLIATFGSCGSAVFADNLSLMA